MPGLHVQRRVAELIQRAALLAVVCGLIPSIAGAQAAPQIPSTVPEIWNEWCARCHGRDGSGKVSQPTVNVVPMNFTECAIASAEPDADWMAAIRHGGPAVGLSSQMPAFGEVLDDDRVIGLVAHIRRFCAERNWPSGNLNFPRPIFTEKAFPENEVVLLPVFAHRKNHPDTAELRTVYERRLGRRAQLEFVAAGRIRLRRRSQARPRRRRAGREVRPQPAGGPITSSARASTSSFRPAPSRGSPAASIRCSSPTSRSRRRSARRTCRRS